MQSTYDKHGQIGYSLLEECDGLDSLLVQEDFWMAELGTMAPDGMNLKSAELQLHSEITKQKMSADRMGEGNSFFARKHTPETIERIKESCRQYTPSDETKAKISKAVSGEKNPFFGKRHSDETRRKIKEARNKRGPVSDETREKMSKKRKGQPKSEETKRRMIEAAKRRWAKVRQQRDDS
jgi:hypothetical protein